ncbi:hypothetical protein VPH35_105911 [Triticum aestivum]|uniref:VQ domain-containing protein n=1 Tax=Triticum aestivum TaxID=4565 RepID=A0A3B6NTK9_WHEAT|nr:uncharacterized protein LOC123130949 [Triticum aestivum]
MYSCSERDRSAAAARIMESSAKYQPCNTAATRTAAGQVPSDAQRQQQQPSPRRARRKHPASASRRSSTTVVATDVSNFRAMVQELTGFPPAAIFRPLPRRAHAATTAGSVRGVVQPLAHPPKCAPPGVFDGLPDLGSPEFDTSPDLIFE